MCSRKQKMKMRGLMFIFYSVFKYDKEICKENKDINVELKSVFEAVKCNIDTKEKIKLVMWRTNLRKLFPEFILPKNERNGGKNRERYAY